VANDNFGPDWDGGNFPECSKEVLHCVLLPGGYEMLCVVWVMNLGMLYQQGQGVPCNDSLHAEGCIQMQRCQRVIWGGQCFLARASGEARGLLPISSIRVAGVSRSEKVHGIVTLRHFIRIFCFDAPQNRLFFGMTAVRPSLDRNFRFPSAIVVASRHLASSVTSKWSTLRYGLPSIAICLAGEGA